MKSISYRHSHCQKFHFHRPGKELLERLSSSLESALNVDTDLADPELTDPLPGNETRNEMKVSEKYSNFHLPSLTDTWTRGEPCSSKNILGFTVTHSHRSRRTLND